MTRLFYTLYSKSNLVIFLALLTSCTPLLPQTSAPTPTPTPTPVTCICSQPSVTPSVAAAPTPVTDTTILQTKAVNGNVSTTPKLTEEECKIAKANIKTGTDITEANGQPHPANILIADCLDVKAPLSSIKKKHTVKKPKPNVSN
jgi:hypothetical protein